jgi:hypothetical protein
MSDLAKHPAHLSVPKGACKTHNFTNTPREYYAYHAWVERRYKSGHRQTQCKKCGLWLFPDEMNIVKDNPPKLVVDILKLLEDILLELRVSGVKENVYKARLRKLKKRVGVMQWR